MIVYGNDGKLIFCKDGEYEIVDTFNDVIEIRTKEGDRYLVKLTYNEGNDIMPSEVIGGHQDIIAPMTLRFKFQNTELDPNTLGITKGTWNKVSNGIWDWTYEDPNWGSAFSNKLTESRSGNVQIIGSGDLSNVTNLSFTFNSCDALGYAILNNTINCVTFQGTFMYCLSLENAELTDTTNASRMDDMFAHCTSMVTAPFMNTSGVTTMSNMFSDCRNLETIPLYDTSKVNNMNFMFSDCHKLETIPLFDTSAVTSMWSTFYECTSLTEIPDFDLSNVEQMNYTFNGCTNVQYGMFNIYSKADSLGIQWHENTFKNCGTNTETGRADRQLIPESWGGDGH